jgi:sensor histidine kinase YesM
MKESHSISLKNVNQRIQLLFGDAYGLMILPVSSGGTVVSITLPVIT